MPFKDLRVQVKAGPSDGLAEGQFTAYASVFGNVDSYGDVVVAGAFTDTLSEWKSSGLPIPLLWGHNMSDPDYNIGAVPDAAQDDKGLLVTGQLDLDSPKSTQVYRLLKSGRVNQMSFAYDVVDGGPVTTDGKTVFELRKLKLYEVSVVPIGANQETEVLAVKSAAEMLAKEGRVLAAKHIDSLRSAHEAIGAVIEAAEKAKEDDQGKASGSTAHKDEGGNVKSEDAPSSPSAKSLATRELHLLAVNN